MFGLVGYAWTEGKVQHLWGGYQFDKNGNLIDKDGNRVEAWDKPEEIKKLQAESRNKEREESAFDICLTKIKKFNFPMRLLRVEYTFDRNKIVFFFTADGRIDFRELVKELAAVFHARIELRQVGVRDEAKQVNGIGPCGRPLCCANFLGEFAPVSIKMAKIQGLSLNPSKISGVCGRLMCCLRYENDQYKNDPERRKTCCKMKKRYDNPKFFVGMKVITEEGSGQVVYVNSQKHTVKIQFESNQVKILPWSEVEEAENE